MDFQSIGFQRGQSSKAALNIGLRAKISSWLDEMEVEEYTINDDFTIDIKGSVFLNGKLDGNFPSFIKFGKVRDNFYCSNNKLTSLKGVPKSTGGYFSCRSNNLTSLKGAPKTIGGDFSCMNNNLASLEGAPKYVGEYFNCENNYVQFTKEGVKKVSNVKGEIYV